MRIVPTDSGTTFEFSLGKELPVPTLNPVDAEATLYTPRDSTQFTVEGRHDLPMVCRSMLTDVTVHHTTSHINLAARGVREIVDFIMRSNVRNVCSFPQVSPNEYPVPSKMMDVFHDVVHWSMSRRNTKTINTTLEKSSFTKIEIAHIGSTILSVTCDRYMFPLLAAILKGIAVYEEIKTDIALENLSSPIARKPSEVLHIAAQRVTNGPMANRADLVYKEAVDRILSPNAYADLRPFHSFVAVGKALTPGSVKLTIDFVQWDYIPSKYSAIPTYIIPNNMHHLFAESFTKANLRLYDMRGRWVHSTDTESFDI